VRVVPVTVRRTVEATIPAPRETAEPEEERAPSLTMAAGEGRILVSFEGGTSRRKRERTVSVVVEGEVTARDALEDGNARVKVNLTNEVFGRESDLDPLSSFGAAGDPLLRRRTETES
jgi:hypothetical protein